MNGGLFMPHQHMLNRVLFVERVVDMQNRSARVAPDMLDAFRLQALDENFSPAQFLA